MLRHVHAMAGVLSSPAWAALLHAAAMRHPYVPVLRLIPADAGAHGGRARGCHQARRVAVDRLVPARFVWC